MIDMIPSFKILEIIYYKKYILLNKVISIKCMLFTYICAGYIANYHVVDFLEIFNVIQTYDSASSTERLTGI